MQIEKILAIKLRSMGDTVILLASLRELIRAFPQAEIHALVPSEWSSLLEGIPGLHSIQKAPPSWKNLSFLKNLRAERYSCVVNFHASPSSALMARWSGAPIRSVHFHGHQSKNRYSTVEIPGKGIVKPIIERDMDAVRALGVHVPAGRLPQVQLQESEIHSAQNYLKSLGLNAPILGLGLGASRPTKAWPLERWSTLALEWCQKTQGSVLALAGPTEGNLVLSFLKNMDDILPTQSPIRKKIQITHGLEVRQMAATLSQITVFAGNDSGPKHVAVAVKTPTVTIFGPEHPFEWHPYPLDQNPFHLIDPLPCRKSADPGMPTWCGLSECTTEEHKCMKMIGVNAVLANCLKLIP